MRSVDVAIAVSLLLPLGIITTGCSEDAGAGPDEPNDASSVSGGASPGGGGGTAGGASGTGGGSSDGTGGGSSGAPGGPLDAGTESVCAESPRHIALTNDSGCAIRTDGTITCWGVSAPEPPAGSFCDIDGGADTYCALAPDGRIQCWGVVDNHTPIPTGIANAMAVGSDHACAVWATGSNLSCWGILRDGLDTPPTHPAGFKNVVAGTGFACALAGDGTIHCWGLDDYGQTEAPSGTFVTLSAGYRHACAIDEAGALSCWGAVGQVPDVGITDPPTGSFTALGAGWYHSCAATEDGSVSCWGSGASDGSCAGPELACSQGMPPDGLLAEELDGGFTHTCAITRAGSLECWGSDTGGRSTPPADFQ